MIYLENYPPEIRLKIWNFARLCPRYFELHVEHACSSDLDYYLEILGVSQPRMELTQVNSESRKEILRHYAPIQPRKHIAFGIREGPLYFNADIDVPYITRVWWHVEYLGCDPLARGFFQTLIDVGRRVRTLAFDVDLLLLSDIKKFLPQEQSLRDLKELLIVVGKASEERQLVLTPCGCQNEERTCDQGCQIVNPEHIRNQIREFVNGFDDDHSDDESYFPSIFASVISDLLMSLIPKTASWNSERFHRGEEWKRLEAEGKVPTIKIMAMKHTGCTGFVSHKL